MRFKFFALILFMLGSEGCFIPAVAKVSNSVTSSTITSTLETHLSDVLENPEPQGWSLGVESSSYVSWKNHPDNDRNPYGAHLGVERLHKFSRFDLGLSGHAYFSLNQSYLNYTHLDEFNFRFRDFLGAQQVVFGRYRNTWSTGDDYWRLGMYQPMFMWNFLKPEDQGLTGMFFKWKLQNMHMDFMASPFYVPSQGPSYLVRDGHFESANPWFSNPVNQFLIGNGEFTIRYHVNEPSAGNIVMNPGAALNFSSLDSGKNWWSFGGAFKPSNRLELGLTGKGTLDREYDVEIYPFVIYHTLANLEYGWHFSNSDFLLTAVSEWPNAVSVPQNQSAIQPGRAVVLSPIWVYYLNRKIERKVSLAYIYVDEQDFSHVGDLDLANAANKGSRYFFKNAVSASFQGRPLPSIPMNLLAQTIYDFTKKGVLIVGEVNFAVAPKWQMAMGMETIGVDDDSMSSFQNSFMQFRSNDRIYAGVSYVF